MALTSKIVKRVSLPHEMGQWVDVRMPSLEILDLARTARLHKLFGLMAEVDLAKIKDLPSAKGQAEGGSEYDWQLLLTACVKAWSYEAPVTPENVADLDAETVKVLTAALLPAETEGERKNA